MKYSKLAKSVKFKKKFFSYKAVSFSNQLEFVGEGRSASVFRIKGTNKVMKVFFPSYTSLSLKEYNVYRNLRDESAFPVCYEYGQGYLVLDYIDGKTIFDCLIHGKVISKEMVDYIDTCFYRIRKLNLYPSDMHLKNIMITSDNRVKIIDVARFNDSFQDRRWHDLKFAYNWFYRFQFTPKRYPSWLLTVIGFIYKKVI
jgi:predicted Ser/Thr protein kinase